MLCGGVLIYLGNRASLGRGKKRLPGWLPGYTNKICRDDPAKRLFEKLVRSLYSVLYPPPYMYCGAENTKGTLVKRLHLKAKGTSRL